MRLTSTWTWPGGEGSRVVSSMPTSCHRCRSHARRRTVVGDAAHHRPARVLTLNLCALLIPLTSRSATTARRSAISGTCSPWCDHHDGRGRDVLCVLRWHCACRCRLPLHPVTLFLIAVRLGLRHVTQAIDGTATSRRRPVPPCWQPWSRWSCWPRDGQGRHGRIRGAWPTWRSSWRPQIERLPSSPTSGSTRWWRHRGPGWGAGTTRGVAGGGPRSRCGRRCATSKTSCTPA